MQEATKLTNNAIIPSYEQTFLFDSRVHSHTCFQYHSPFGTAYLKWAWQVSDFTRTKKKTRSSNFTAKTTHTCAHTFLCTNREKRSRTHVRAMCVNEGELTMGSPPRGN